MNTNTGKPRHVSRHSNGLNDLRRKLLPASLFSLLGLFACGGEAWAGGAVAANATPTGGTIVGGSGAISQNGANTTIVQKSQMLALNWQSFNVGANASVLFKQPSFTSVALNRILDQNPSQIFGHVNANGQIFLINTHGIIFGAGSQMNVGGLVASTLDLTPSDFLANHFNLDAHGGSAGIVNHGTIEAASGGSVSLIGGQVENDGVILANYGHINLDGADRAVLDFDGDGLINVQVTGALQKRLNADEAAVSNKGKLQADSGTVVLQASAAKDLFTNLVNNTGVVSAGGISTRGGKVQLIASGGNTVTSGTIDVSGAEGGSVQVLSDQDVGVTGNINASGTQGGGSIRVGGGYQGGEGLQTANATYVAPTATLNADATQGGNGGSVVVWGNQVNNFYGSISARGGALGGDGGLVETSSHDGLNAQGNVDASAAHGKAGTWLLDPYDVTISNGTTNNITTGGTTGNVTYTANGSSSVIKNSTIDAALTGGTNVFVFTDTAANGGGTGNITVSNPIVAAGAGSLYLQAVGSIFVNANIYGDGSHPLNLYLWANYGGAAQGTSYVSNAACPACQVVIGKSASATIDTTSTSTNGTVDIETGDASNAGGALLLGQSSNNVAINAGTLTVNTTGVTQTTHGGGVNVANATLNAGAGAVSLINTNNNFTGTVSLTNSGANAVTIDNGGNALTLGSVSMGSGALTVSDAGFGTGITLDNNVTTSGTQTYNSVVTLGASSLTLTGTTIKFASDVNGTGDSLTINGNAIIAGSFGSSLGAVSVTGTAEFDDNLTTTGAQTYTGAVTLNGGNVTLQGSSVSLPAGVSDGGNGYSLAITGNAALGGTSTLKALSVSGTSVLGGNITTASGGTQTYSGAVTLSGDTTLAASGTGGGITFGDLVDSTGTNHALVLNAGSDTTTFSKAVGSLLQLSSLTSTGTGKVVLDGNVSTTGAQSYAGVAQLGSGVTQLTGSTVTASSGITGYSLGFNTLTITGNASLSGTSSKLASLTITGTSALGGSVTTSGTQDYQGPITLSGGTTLAGSTVTLEKTVTGASHNLTITGNAALDGAVTGVGALSVSGTSALNANVITSGTQTYSGAVTLGNSITLDSTGANVAFGSTVDNATATQQSLTVDALSGLASFGGAVGAGPNGALAALTTQSKTFSAGALTIGAGGLSVTTTGGGIAQTGAFTVTNGGISNFNAGGHAITLANPGNNFTGNVFLSNSGANDVTLSNNGNPLLLGNINVGSGALNLSGAGITQASGSITQAAGGGTATFNAGTNALTLNSGSNSFTGAVDLIGGNTQIASGSALNLGAGTINGTLAVSNTGAISQSGALTVTGAATFTQTSTTAGSTQDIVLDNVGNDFKSTVDFASGSGAQIHSLSLTNTDATPGALTLPGSITGDLTLDYTAAVLALPSIQVGGNLSATSANGISQSGALVVTGTSTFDGGTNAITLNDSGNSFAGAVALNGGNTSITSGSALNLGAGTVNGTLTVSNTGTISQSGPLTVTGAASFTQNGNADILLDNPGNQFENTIGFAGTQINNLAFVNAYTSPGALTLPTSVAGNLTLSEYAATLTLPATSVGGTLDVTNTDTSGVIAIGGVESTGGGQTYHSAVTLSADAQLTSTGNGAIDFVSSVSGPANTLTLNTGGAVTFGSTTQLGSLSSSSGTFGSNALNIVNNLSITTTSGAITQTGAFSVGGTSIFNAGSNAITLNDANNAFTGAVSLTGGTTVINQKSALALILGTLNTGALTVTSHGTLNLGTGRVNGALSANSNGNAILQTGALTVNSTSNINAGSNTITLTSANDFAGAVTLTGGTTQITNGAAQLTLGTLNTGALTATSGAGLSLGGGTVGGTLTATGSGPISQSGALTVNGAASITQNGSAQDVLLDNIGNQFKSTVGFAGTQIRNLSFANAYATSSSGLTLPASISGNLTLIYPNAGLSLPGTTVGGALSITAGNGITINGNETTGGGQTYNSAVTLGADAALHSTGNGTIDFASTVNGAHVLTLNTGGDVLLGGAAMLNGLTSTSNTFSGNALTISNGGNLSITTTGGAITQSGAFTVTGSSTFNAGGNAITLLNGGNSFAGPVALTGGTTKISQSSALTLSAVHTGSLTVSSQGDLNLGSGSVNGDLTATSNGGAIGEGGALSVSGNSTLNAGTGAITLANAGNAFGGAVNLTGGVTQISDAAALSLGTLNTGDLTATSTGNLNLGSGNVGGNLVATSNGGAINQTGALSVAGTTALNGGNGAISLTDSGNTFTGAVTATGAGVALNDAGDLTVASLTDNANGSVALTAGGTLTAYGISAGSGDIALASNGGTLSTGGAISGGNISLTGHNGITSTNSITASGALTMTSANGAITSAGGLSAGTLTGSSAGATALNGTNTIGTLGTFSANGFSLSNGQSLTVSGPITGNGSTALTVTSGDLTLNGLVSGTSTVLNAAGNINQGSGGGIVASTLSGGAGGAATLSGSGNQIGALGNFGASHFTLLDGPALTINGTVNGGTSTAITVTNGGLAIKGAVLGTTTTLNAAGAIIENGGSITAGTLSGGAAGAAALDGNNQVGALGNFSANGFSLNDGQALTVNGSVNGNGSTALTTTSGGIAINGTVIGTTVALNSAGSISEGSNGIQAGTLTGSSIGATTLNGANQIGSLGPFTANGFSLTDAQALTVNGAVSGGGSLALTTTSGGIAINSAVSGTATSLNAAGTLSEGAGGSITAATLSGNAGGVTTLTGANKVGTLGGFRSLSGFSFVDDQSLTLSSMNGSSYVVNAGTSPLSIAVTHGNLYQADHTWSYDGTGSWSASGAIGTQANPIYVTGVGTQYVTLVGDPPAYFYAVDRNGNILSIIGDSVNVPTSLFSSRAQNVNNHLDSYIDASVITANYRSFGIVPSGILLPPDQQSCQAGSGGVDCADE